MSMYGSFIRAIRFEIERVIQSHCAEVRAATALRHINTVYATDSAVVTQELHLRFEAVAISSGAVGILSLNASEPARAGLWLRL